MYVTMNNSLPVQSILELFNQHHTEPLSLDYDRDADVLYVNFQRPAVADHSEMDENDTVIRYQGDRMVGFTILNASLRQ
jgi:uncharacterized protein YuzE